MEITADVGKHQEGSENYPLNIFKVAVSLCNIEKRGFSVSILQYLITSWLAASSDPQKFKCPRKLVNVNYTNQLIEDSFIPPTKLIGLGHDEAIKFKVSLLSIMNLQPIAEPKKIRKNIHLYRTEIHGTYRK